ncbi:hypothetical protein SEA_NEDARYA_93 [Gordonia phage Nedarya]|nr:hypothetical protein SEA_NEDARYA_93 [Gordonia phage Nedarya]
MDEFDRGFYLEMIKLENSVGYSVQDTEEIPLFCLLSSRMDY